MQGALFTAYSFLGFYGLNFNWNSSFNLDYDLATFCIMKVSLRLLIPPFLNINDSFFSWFLWARFQCKWVYSTSLQVFYKIYIPLPPPRATFLSFVVWTWLLKGFCTFIWFLIVYGMCKALLLYASLNCRDIGHLEKH